MANTARENGSSFRYNSYWGIWSLVLTNRCNAKPGYGPSVEIDLSPVNGWARANGDYLAKICAINVRRHCTSPDRKDVIANELPAEYEALARQHLGDEVFEFLTDPTAEILGIIDWELYNSNCNGGASLRDIAKMRFARRIPAALGTEVQMAA